MDQNNAIHTFTALLNTRDKKLAHYVIFTLSNMAVVLPSSREKIQEAGSIGRLMAWLNMAHDLETKKDIIYALLNISDQNLSNQKAIYDSGFVGLIVETLTTPGCDIDTQEKGLWLLRNLFKNLVIQREMVQTFFTEDEDSFFEQLKTLFKGTKKLPLSMQQDFIDIGQLLISYSIPKPKPPQGSLQTFFHDPQASSHAPQESATTNMAKEELSIEDAVVEILTTKEFIGFILLTMLLKSKAETLTEKTVAALFLTTLFVFGVVCYAHKNKPAPDNKQLEFKL